MYVFRFQYTFSGSTFIGFRCRHGIFHTKLVRTEVRYVERTFYVLENKGKLRYDKYYIYVQKTFVVRLTHTLFYTYYMYVLNTCAVNAPQTFRTEITPF